MDGRRPHNPWLHWQLKFVNYCNENLGNEPFPEGVTFLFPFSRMVWNGSCLHTMKQIVINWDRRYVHIPTHDPRYRIQRVQFNIKNRTESFLFLLAHEMRHLQILNHEAIYSLNGIRKKRRVWLGEADANGFGQSCVYIYRGMKSQEHYAEFENLQKKNG